MSAIRILPLLAMVSLPGCDGIGDFLRGRAPAAAYAAPLASDTTVVTVRRVWSSSGPNPGSGIDLRFVTIMPNGAGLATIDRMTGDPAIVDLASRELRRVRSGDEPDGTGRARVPVPSPDGRRIAVAWSNALEPQLQLRIVDVATGESRTIMTADTANASSLRPVAWTPAGDSVFASLFPNRLQGDVRVMLIPAAGGTPRLVHAFPVNRYEWRMSLSPDGRWLLYDHEQSRGERVQSDIYIIDVQGGGARALVEHPGLDLLVSWLPGTDVVLFSSDRSGTTDLWSVRVVNGRASEEPRRVRSGFFRSHVVGFGDGALFYRVDTSRRGISVLNVDPQSGALLGGPSPPLAELRTATFPAWSPDGHSLASPTVGRGGQGVTVHSMGSGDSRAFFLDDKGVHAWAVEWTADGKALLFRAGELRSQPTAPQHFLSLDLVTGSTTRLFATPDPGEPAILLRFIVTPDGRSIVLRQQRTLDDGRVETKLVLRSLEDGSDRELHRTSGVIPEFRLSTDGTQLAFMHQAEEDRESLVVMRMDGSQPLRHVASWAHDVVSLLGWLPAGTALLAARLTEDGTREEILRIELDGTATVTGISPFRPMRHPGFRSNRRSMLVLSPGGNRLLHPVADAGEELWRMDGLNELFARDAAVRR